MSFGKIHPMTLTAILSAVPEEQQGLIELLHAPRKVRHAGRDIWLGDLHGQTVALALSRIGKVAAATTATALIERFGAARIVFTGVAGGLGEGVKVGDVVVASSFIQHDMNASPLFPRYQVPFYAHACFNADPDLSARLVRAAHAALAQAAPATAYAGAQVHQGLIASGDRFVSGAQESLALRTTLASAGHAVLAVEMEGAAVAQVCFDYGVPFAAVRAVSDRADELAHVDFAEFVTQVASVYARLIIGHLLDSLSNK